MKKLICLIMIPLLFVACSNDSEKTDELLEAILTDASNFMKLTPWCMYCSNSEMLGVTMFNDELRKDDKVVELFNRKDCFSTMETKYRTFVNMEIDNETMEGSLLNWQRKYFEMILASDICMSKLKEKEKIKLMEMALESLDYGKNGTNEACHIIISILKSCNYTPFVKDVGARLKETILGYSFSLGDGLMYWGLSDKHAEIIIPYARQFLKEKK